MKNKDVVELIISIVTLLIAVCSLLWSWVNSRRTERLNRNNILGEIHDKIRGGRHAMSDIYNYWDKGKNKKVSELSVDEKKLFIEYYNQNYHRKASNTLERKQSDQIHIYLHELHDLWNRIKNDEFSKEEVLEKIGSSIDMDSELIDIYLKAHWLEHRGKKFWENVPDIVDAATKWQLNRTLTEESISLVSRNC